MKQTRRKRDWRERFEEKCTDDPGGCRLWQGALNSNGYGTFWLDGKMQYAHRVALLLSGNSVAVDAEVDHLCRVRNCVNPEHMEVVAHRENTLRGDTVSGNSARKTHCIRGHMLPPVSNGRRRCKPCAALADASRPARDWSKINRRK